MYQKNKLHQDIRDAVLVCMETTDIKDIRVQTLLRMTGISKATFYRNYRSVESIVKEMEAEFVSGLRDINSRFIGSRLQNPILLQQNSEAITRYLDQHRRFLQIINGPHGDPQFDYKHSRVLMEQLISAVTPQSSLHPYYLRFLIDGTNSVLNSWLSDPAPLSPEKMAVILTDMFRRVLL